MSQHLHLTFICGITDFPHDAGGNPICGASRSEKVYPQYVPAEVPGSIAEWQEAPMHDPVRVPLPDTTANLAAYHERRLDESPHEHTLTRWLDDMQLLLDISVHDRLRKAVASDLPEMVGPAALDVVYWQGWSVPDNAAADAGVIGYIIDSLPYNGTMGYAFGSIYPAISLTAAGYAILPSIPLDQAGSADSLFLRFLIEQAAHDSTFYTRIIQRSYWSQARKQGVNLRALNRRKQIIRDGHLYQHFLIEIDSILATAMWVFNWMGLRVHKRDLRLMLCWNWGYDTETGPARP